ncbi:MAG: hypothetical protein H0V56_12955 [Chthoniobacterales bacterium]|nr:hypothetical protein [Chthoniobacterales bacterium]
MFSYLHPGFMTLDFYGNGAVLLRVVVPPGGEVVYSTWLRGESRQAGAYSCEQRTSARRAGGFSGRNAIRND